MNFKVLLNLTFVLALLVAPTTLFASGAGVSAVASCDSLFVSQDDASAQARLSGSPASDPARRARIVRGDLEPLSTGQWLNRLEDSGRLSYRGNHSSLSGTEFVASNEGDWHKTPFDGKHTDVLIGFGTNSAWEILANKSANTFVLADWSPLPLFAHAYVLEPLMRISKTPLQLMIHLAGRDPSTAPQNIPVEKAAAMLGQRFEMHPREIEAFLDYLSRHKEISDEELEFMSFYFRSRDVRAQLMRMFGHDLSPFAELRGPSFSNFNLFFQLRYEQVPAKMQAFSVFHNQKNFDHVRSLYVGRHVEYALAGVSDIAFYQNVQRRHPTSQSWTLSVTNIFDMDYNGLAFGDLQNLLANVVTTAGISQSKPLTVFRTTNYQSPHGFYRYDVSGAIDVPQHDAVDSKVPGKPPRASGW